MLVVILVTRLNIMFYHQKKKQFFCFFNLKRLWQPPHVVTVLLSYGPVGAQDDQFLFFLLLVLIGLHTVNHRQIHSVHSINIYKHLHVQGAVPRRGRPSAAQPATDSALGGGGGWG